MVQVLVVHTLYTQRGGEDRVFAAEVELLRGYSGEISTVVFNNRDVAGMSVARQAAVTLWNQEAAGQVRAAIRESRPDVVHVHNTFPIASPGVIRAAAAEGVPVVMTLHNYRLLCINGLLMRGGRVCEACLGRLPWRSVFYGCWRGRPESAVAAASLTLHRMIGTWELVDRFIALTEFGRRKFIEAGLPADRIVVKPNFVDPDPGPGNGSGGYALFVGRLSTEKGIETLLAAWPRVEGRRELWIIGDGPMRGVVEEAAAMDGRIRYLGRRPAQEVLELMGQAAFLMFPSLWYEGFPMVLAEAFAKGLPVVTSDIGAQATIVNDGRTGLHFRVGSPEDLAAKATWLFEHPEVLTRMRVEARKEYEAKYTGERNFQMLMRIYEEVTGRSRGRRRWLH